MKAYAPNGSPILGTSERVLAVARVIDFTRLPDGSIDFDHEGGSDIFWDTMETLHRDGKTLFLSYDGDEYTEDEIILCEDEFVDPTAQEVCPTY